MSQLELLQWKWKMGLTYWKELLDNEFNRLQEEWNQQLESGAIKEPSHYADLDKGKKYTLSSSGDGPHHKKHKGPKIILDDSNNETNSNVSTTAEASAASSGNEAFNGNASTTAHVPTTASEGDDETNSNASTAAGISSTTSKGNNEINNNISTTTKAPITTTSDTNTEGQDVDASHKGQLSSHSISGTIQSIADIAGATSAEDNVMIHLVHL